MLFGGIAFENNDTVRIQGPLNVTMGPGVRSLNYSALWSAGDLRVLAPRGMTMLFKDIMSKSRGAAVQAARNLWVEGPGTMLFENLHSDGSGGALNADSHCVYAGVGRLQFRNCSASYAGGAIYGGHCVELNSSTGDAIHFEHCRAEWRGGAVASRGNIRLMGRGSFVFKRCHSRSCGGAVGTHVDVVIELESSGSVVFTQCQTASEYYGGGGGGGAVSSGRDIHISHRGHVLFSACSSENRRGNAMIAKQGIIGIGEETKVALANMEDIAGSAMFARTVVLPPDGDLLPNDVLATNELLASQAEFQSNNSICPAGSRFSIGADSGPVLGRCIMCPRGTVSLAPSVLQVQDQVHAVTEGMKLVLVHHSSPNSLRSLGISILNTSSASSLQDHILGITRGPWDTEWLITPVMLSHTHKLAMTFHNGQLQSADGGRLAVPFHNYAADAPLTIIQSGETVNWRNVSDTKMFHIDGSGIISPLHAPLMAIGIDRDVVYKYEPADPFQACVSCHDLARQLADKVECLGGTHAASLSGYMLLLEKGQRTLDVHACPNKAACPGSNLTVSAKGELSSSSRLCSEGYAPTAGAYVALQDMDAHNWTRSPVRHVIPNRTQTTAKHLLPTICGGCY